MAAAAVLVVAGAIVAAVLLTSGGSADRPIVHGSLTIWGGGGYLMYNPCYGTNDGLVDNSDLTPGTPVKVLDASGTIIGTGSLQPGQVVRIPRFGKVCRMSFNMRLDTTSPHYQLVIANRQPYNFTNPARLDLMVGPR